MSYQIKEHFSIPILEYKTVDVGKNKIRIKGIALKGGVISKNNREYIVSELRKACNTWIGKPVNINHDDNNKAGHITWMDYDEYGDLLTYEAEINKQPYVDLLRNGSSKIRGMSIQADYLFNRCYKCGEKLFSETDFDAHMWTQHFLKTDATKTQPHGIMGNGIALVLSPEVPGYEGTTVELAETARLTTLRLLETVIKERKEINEMTQKLGDKAVFTPISRTTIDRAKQQIREDNQPATHQVLPTSPPDPETEQADTLPEASITAPEQPETKVTEELECPVGYHAEGEECVMDKEEEPAEETVEENPESQIPVPHPVTTPHVASDPEEDQSDTLPESSITVPKQPEVKVTEIKLPKLLKLGEPFSGYTDFSDCVSKNADKDDPEAYCASIKQKVEKETVQETYALHAPYVRDMTQSEAINKLTKAVAELSLTTPQNMKALSETIHETMADIVNQTNKQERAALQFTANTFKTSSKRLTASETNFTKSLQALQESSKAIRNEFNKKIDALVSINNKKLGNLATEIAKRDKQNSIKLSEQLSAIKIPSLVPLTEQLAKTEKELTAKISELQKVKETFDQLLASADKNAEARDTQILSLEKRVEEYEQKKLQETVNLSTLQNRVDNIEDKVKPQFKAHSQALTETVEEVGDKPYIKDPHTRSK